MCMIIRRPFSPGRRAGKCRSSWKIHGCRTSHFSGDCVHSLFRTSFVMFLTICLVPSIETRASPPCIKDSLGVEVTAGPYVVQSVSLKGAGAHRSLVYNITGQLSVLPAAVERKHRLSLRPCCSATLFQNLPSSVFADPYELQNNAKRRGENIPIFDGEIELERPEQDSKDSSVSVVVSLQLTERKTSTSEQNSFGVARNSRPKHTNSWDFTGSFSMPVHARYPRAFKRSTEKTGPNLSLAAFLSWLDANYVDQLIPYPKVEVDCSITTSSHSDMAGNEVDSVMLPSNEAKLLYNSHLTIFGQPDYQPQAAVRHPAGPGDVHATKGNEVALNQQITDRSVQSLLDFDYEVIQADGPEGLMWRIPAGDIRHDLVVQISTSALLWVGAISIFVGSMRYGLWHKSNKRSKGD